MLPRIRGSILLPISLALLGCAPKQPAPPPQPSRAGLAGTAWRVVEFRGGDGTVLRADDPAKYTVEFGTDGSVAARIDCNRGKGTFTSAGPSHVEFGPLALTRAACPPAPLTDRLAKDWTYVRSYVMKDGHLFLSLMADGGIYELEPVSAGQSARAVLRGTASYRERMALPPGAVLEVRLEDVSRADAPAEVLGTARVERPGNPPIPFEISYDPARIQQRHRYVVRATVSLDGKPLLVTDTPVTVLPEGSGGELTLMLRRAEPPAGS